MNIYGLVILVTLLFSYLLELFTNILNLRSIRGELPSEFREVFDENEYQKSQDYTKVKTRFGFLTSGTGLLATLVFWFAGGFNLLDLLVRSWHFGLIVSGLFYISILILLRSLLGLPFSVYSTFVIEERFGFNKTTPRTFILDMLKGTLLGVVLGGPLLAALLFFFDYAGNIAWLYCWLGTTIFTLIVQFIAPTWIMPLFNKFIPLEDGELKSAITGYADKVKFPLKGIYVMDGSKRSSKSNAFFTGFGKNKRIALFDTLIERHTIPELVAVLAHEIGHYKKKHIQKGIMISILHMGVVFYLLSIFISHPGLFEAFFMDHQSVYAGLIFFGMLYTPIELILSVFMQIFSRRNEYAADQFAAMTTGDAVPMINALKKLSLHNLSNLRPHPLYVFLNYSHPPVLERIQALRQFDFSSTLV
jgi:STE24 endopeptidase